VPSLTVGQPWPLLIVKPHPSRPGLRLIGWRVINLERDASTVPTGLSAGVGTARRRRPGYPFGQPNRLASPIWVVISDCDGGLADPGHPH